MSIDATVQKEIRKIVLRNAVEYGGNARYDVVISKVVGLRPDLRPTIKQQIPLIKKIVDEVNSLDHAEQQRMASKLLVFEDTRGKRSEEPSLPPLQGAIMGKVITRFPPEPNGYPHIGHAKAAIIDQEYARIYRGKLILRFDDTNPLNEQLEFYNAIKEGLEWLGIEPDLVKNTSDDIELLQSYGKEMVMKGDAYVCTCRPENIHMMRAKGVNCPCRGRNSGEYLTQLEKFFDGSFEQNEAIIRFRGDMSDLNTAMRDPTLFRIIDADHPKLGRRIREFPTYDFAAPIEDSLDGVTHAMRTKEYELRNELYFSVLRSLGLRNPLLLEFSRLEFEGMPVSKRKLKPLIEGGLVSGWDDPRLPTLAGLRKKGILPEAIHKFVISLGISLADTRPPFEALESYNRKFLDLISLRLFFVKNPMEIRISNPIFNKVVLKNHPTQQQLGTRSVQTSDRIYIDKEDADQLERGEEIRLMEMHNIQLDEVIQGNSSKYLRVTNTGTEIKPNIPKVQWVSNDDMIPFTVIVPGKLFLGNEFNKDSLHVYNGVSESYVSKVRAASSIQFVRFGFCRLQTDGVAIYTHG
ncbi:MAG TPA: glutamate--tRNA ligase [Nitrososphaeraceae archaeon]|nr:glutamate--tRNA ligase [Nitrososphaeraceae archaeon]